MTSILADSCVILVCIFGRSWVVVAIETVGAYSVTGVARAEVSARDGFVSVSTLSGIIDDSSDSSV